MSEKLKQKSTLEQSEISQREKNFSDFYPKNVNSTPQQGTTEAIELTVLKKKKKRKNQKRNEKRRKKKIKEEEQKNLDSMEECCENCQLKYSSSGINLEEIDDSIKEKAIEEKKQNKEKTEIDNGDKATENIFKSNCQKNIIKKNNNSNINTTLQKKQLIQSNNTNTSSKVISLIVKKDDDLLDFNSRLYPPYLCCNSRVIQLAYENRIELDEPPDTGNFFFYYPGYFFGGNPISFKSTKANTG